MIKIRYSAVDGFSKRKSFKTLKGARKYAIEMLGKYPSFGSYYAVSDDGVGKIEVIEGVKLRDLFGEEPGAPTEEEIEAAQQAAWEAAMRTEEEVEFAQIRAEYEKLNKPRSRDPRCTCSEQQLALVGCNCVECDDIPF